MSGFEFDLRSLLIYLGLSVVLGGAASFSAGRALAMRWRPFWQALVYALGLAAAARFLHYALFGQPLLSAAGFSLDFAAAFCFILAGFKLTRRRQMRRQYGAVLARGDGQTEDS